MDKELDGCPFCGGKAEIKPTFCGHFIDSAKMVVCTKCNARSDGFSDYATDNIAQAISAWNNRAEQPNEPLTLDELKLMDKEYVWLVDKDEDMPFEGWAVCDGKQIYYLYFNQYCPVGTATIDMTDKWYIKRYGKTWLAYRTKLVEKE